MRISCPGFNSTSRVSPVRLFNRPNIATRSAIGVPICFSAGAVTASPLACAFVVVFFTTEFAFLVASLPLSQAESIAAARAIDALRHIH
jgi:hypothetical protein